MLKGKTGKIFLVGAIACMLAVLGVAGATTAFASGTAEKTDKVAVKLTHTPYGTATLKWDPKSENLWVKISLTGLAPNSTHPAHIHVGDCAAMGPIKYMLNDIKADAAGVGTSVTAIKNVDNGIAASGWSINVHNGPGLKPAAQFTPIACGNVKNSDTSVKQAQNVTVTLGPTNAANQSASGTATLTLKGDTLTVVVSIQGLMPGSRHPEHIHAGSCQKQAPGKIVYMLKDIVADKDGDATVTTVIQNVKDIPDTGWYINVHFSTDLATQTGFDPIACGNVAD